ncbi:bifunctional apoptosis regulator-like isoform X2 [Lineus longissimus]|uniref:bifunctional apoptosis regulator-like isoform X2 n=1 Tax=Lineus longissimus TaxID=88925 RepID=UPI00315CF206
MTDQASGNLSEDGQENLMKNHAWGSDSTGYESAQTTDDAGDGQRHRLFSRTMSQAEFLCSVCYELMVDPTTLNCGHSFCRSCLASWVLSSNTFNCPSCRQPFKGHPKVNILIRSTIEKLFGDAISGREAIMRNDIQTQNHIHEFDRKIQKSMNNSEGFLYRRAIGLGFWKGVGFAIIIMLTGWLVWCWRSTDTDMLVHKPIYKWTSYDVEQWLLELGSWTEEELIPKFRNEKIDGHLLLAINEEDLATRFNVTNALHRRGFMITLDTMKDLGAKAPSNLWEYKALHQGWSLFLLYALKDYPRLGFLIIYLFDYQDTFLPFIHCTSPVGNMENVSLYLTQFPDPTSEQWIDFLSKLLVLPYWLIAKFACEWLDKNFWVSRIVLINCVLLTILEANKFISWKGNWRSIPDVIKGYFRGLLGYSIWVIVWPLVPSFVCDLFFYVTIYLSIFSHSEKVWQALKRHTSRGGAVIL